MKRYYLLILIFGIFINGAQAQQKPGTKNQYYGKAFTNSKVIPAADIKKVLGSRDSVEAKVVGQVQSVCQAKGCWMDIKLADNSVMKVSFKDYAFFVPKNIAGKTVVLNGMAYNKIISVAEQQHYAQDAGLSSAEIKAIKQPKQSVTFTASGVQLK